MNLKRLFSEPIPTSARPMNGLATRLFSALARPYQTSYTAPSLMTASAVLYALRGYDVSWSTVRFDTLYGRRCPSDVSFRYYRHGHGERYPSHGRELDCLFPGLVMTEHRIRAKAGDARARLSLWLKGGSQ